MVIMMMMMMPFQSPILILSGSGSSSGCGCFCSSSSGSSRSTVAIRTPAWLSFAPAPEGALPQRAQRQEAAHLGPAANLRLHSCVTAALWRLQGCWDQVRGPGGLRRGGGGGGPGGGFRFRRPVAGRNRRAPVEERGHEKGFWAHGRFRLG